MSTIITTRSSKGGRLSFAEMDDNFLNLQTTADAAAVKTVVDTSLAGKVDKVSGKGLSTEDYTTTEKSKLSGIESGAQVNVVSSVAGKTGNVLVSKSDVGLGNVDNTSDSNKPVSTATQTALDLKANVSSLSTVATSGAYSDLSGKPSVPSKVSDLTNDSNFQTGSQVTSAIQAVVGAAPAALDTLKEIADKLASDESAVSALTTVVAGKVASNASITAGTGTKISYDAKGLVTSSTTLSASDIPDISATYQPLKSVLTSVGSLSTASTGLVKLTNGVASFDTNTYLTGNQSITFSGDATGSGTTSVALTLASITDSGTGSFKKVAVNSKGLVTGTASVTQSDITGLLGASSITNSMLANGAVANLSGTNTGDQTITLTGDATGSGTGSFAVTLANSGVTAGTYTKITVDAKGRATVGATLSAGDIPDISATYAKLTGATFSGDVTAPNFNSNSDRTLKYNIVKITSATDIVKMLEGVSFNWKETDQKAYGFIAQEVQEIIPELVGRNEALDTLTVNYQGVIPFLVEALKEQEERIAKLEDLLNK